MGRGAFAFTGLPHARLWYPQCGIKVRQPFIYLGTKVSNIEINFVVFKKKKINKSKNICLVKFEVFGYKNVQKLLRIISISDPHQFIQLGVFKKNDRNEINSCTFCVTISL